jgi:hypothetical protein
MVEQRGRGGLGVPIEWNPACLLHAQKPMRLIYGLMAISPYVNPSVRKYYPIALALEN